MAARTHRDALEGDTKTIVRDRITFQTRRTQVCRAPLIAAGLRALGHRHRRLQTPLKGGVVLTRATRADTSRALRRVVRSIAAFRAQQSTSGAKPAAVVVGAPAAVRREPLDLDQDMLVGAAVGQWTTCRNAAQLLGLPCTIISAPGRADRRINHAPVDSYHLGPARRRSPHLARQAAVVEHAHDVAVSKLTSRGVIRESEGSRPRFDAWRRRDRAGCAMVRGWLAIRCSGSACPRPPSHSTVHTAPGTVRQGKRRPCVRRRPDPPAGCPTHGRRSA